MVDALIEHPKEIKKPPCSAARKRSWRIRQPYPFGEIADWGGGNRHSLHTEQATLTKFSGAMLPLEP
jgi:hypothetical protein